MVRIGDLVLAGFLIAVLAIPYAMPIVAALIDPAHGIVGGAREAGPVAGSFESPYGPARVYWDENGIPHVYADSIEAAAYALGWAEASMRLFQMDLLRRVALGNLSALIGEAGLENDRMMQALGMPGSVEKEWELIAADPELDDLEAATLAFTDGVNDYIGYALENNLLPPEYRLLGREPEPWRPEHSIAMEKLLAITLAWKESDLILARLVERHGLEVIVDLDAVNRTRNMAHASCDIATTIGSVVGSVEPGYGYTLAGVDKPVKAPSPFIHGGFSNNWVVSAGLGPDGMPLVANDPHLALTAPPIWMIIHVEAPGWSAAGVTVPGVPFVIIGRTQNLAWGFTNVGSDFVDFYYYKWLDNGTYIYKGKKVKVEKKTYEIPVWNPASREYTIEEYTVEYTVHGPLIAEGPHGKYAVAFTGADVGLGSAFIWKLNRVDTVAEALEAQAKYFLAPVQNYVVADSQGNIAYSPNGGFPVRTNVGIIEAKGIRMANTGFLPYNGSLGEGEWAGYYQSDSLPVVYSGPDGNVKYIATANSKPWEGDCLRIVGWDYHDRFRTQRIYEMLDGLSADGLLSVEDSKIIQLDTVDKGIQTVAEILVDLASGRAGDLEWAVEEVARWTGNPVTSREGSAQTLAVAWAMVFHEMLWEELYGSKEDKGFLRVEMIEELYSRYTSGTLNIDIDLEGLAVDSLSKTIQLLEEYYGTADSEKWTYGRIHYYMIENPVLKTGYPRLEAPGGPFTVNVAPPSTVNPEDGMPVSVGPSTRVISPLAEPVLYISLPGSQDGNPYGSSDPKLYRDWANGVYHTINLGAEPAGYKHLLEFKG